MKCTGLPEVTPIFFVEEESQIYFVPAFSGGSSLSLKGASRRICIPRISPCDALQAGDTSWGYGQAENINPGAGVPSGNLRASFLAVFFCVLHCLPLSGFFSSQGIQHDLGRRAEDIVIPPVAAVQIEFQAGRPLRRQPKGNRDFPGGACRPPGDTPDLFPAARNAVPDFLIKLTFIFPLRSPQNGQSV